MIIAEEQKIFWSGRSNIGHQSGLKAMISANDIKGE